MSNRSPGLWRADDLAFEFQGNRRCRHVPVNVVIIYIVIIIVSFIYLSDFPKPPPPPSPPPHSPPHTSLAMQPAQAILTGTYQSQPRPEY